MNNILLLWVKCHLKATATLNQNLRHTNINGEKNFITYVSIIHHWFAWFSERRGVLSHYGYMWLWQKSWWMTEERNYSETAERKFGARHKDKMNNLSILFLPSNVSIKVLLIPPCSALKLIPTTPCTNTANPVPHHLPSWPPHRT